ncbi:hypothetical protein EV361DRAFT_998694 [Lentinula raphanica]|nr:hypothetical protein EV361DRAFT_998694 [Lentinula raphanica]
MSFTTNPYAQAGWASQGSTPSIFSSPAVPSIHQFRFTNLNPNILDCTVVGPRSVPYFRVTNNSPTPNFTLFQNQEGKSIAVIEWRESTGPVVEVRDIIRKQFVATWLQLSSNRQYRFMQVHDRTFVWMPKGENVELYTYGTGSPVFYAKLSRTRREVVLDMTSAAVQEGLLDCCVVAVVLLQSGRLIE